MLHEIWKPGDPAGIVSDQFPHLRYSILHQVDVLNESILAGLKQQYPDTSIDKLLFSLRKNLGPVVSVLEPYLLDPKKIDGFLVLNSHTTSYILNGSPQGGQVDVAALSGYGSRLVQVLHGEVALQQKNRPQREGTGIEKYLAEAELATLQPFIDTSGRQWNITYPTRVAAYFLTWLNTQTLFSLFNLGKKKSAVRPSIKFFTDLQIDLGTSTPKNIVAN